MMPDNNRKLLALKFAYQILTDNRNSEHYCFSSVRNSMAGKVDYYDMLGLLNEIAKDMNVPTKDGGAEE